MIVDAAFVESCCESIEDAKEAKLLSPARLSRTCADSAEPGAFDHGIKTRIDRDDMPSSLSRLREG